MGFEILDFTSQDSEELAKLAVSAFEQYKDVYDDWDVFISHIATMSSLAENSEIITAKIDNEIVGAVFDENFANELTAELGKLKEFYAYLSKLF